jgi:hypothetical protein
MIEIFNDPDFLIDFENYSQNPSIILNDPRLVASIDD